MKKMFAACLAAAIVAGTLGGCVSKNDGVTSSMPEATPSPSPSPETSANASDSPVEIIIKDAKLKEVYDAVRKEFGEFFVSMPAVVTEQQMTEMYYLNADDVEEFVGEMSLANVSGDTFIGVKAKPGRAEAVKDALEKRKADIVEQFKTYPVNFMDLKSEAAEVVVEGDYVFMVLLGDINIPDGQEASLEMAKKEVERAVRVIESAFKD